MKSIAALSFMFLALTAQAGARELRAVTAVRHWSVGEVTRVAIEVTGDFQFRSDRLHNPERVYYDILDARPRIHSRRIYAEAVSGALLARIRVAETQPGITRVVLELAAPAEATASRLDNPARLIVELRNAPAPPVAPTTTTAPDPILPPPRVAPPPVPNIAKPSIGAEHANAKPESPPRRVYVAEAAPAAVRQPEPVLLEAPKPNASPTLPALAPAPASIANAAAAAPPEVGKAARRTSSGDTSLVRALGLKINRVVIDPGHGGHDQGTEGRKGLLEKDLVLDVSKRVGKLISERLGAEVIYTRTDDTFIPLEGRTALANEKKADLFLSIHANSSPSSRIAGVETYYLNFTNAQDALDVAARENATSEKSIFELRDLIQTITMHNKAEESKEFASRLQASLYAFSARYFPASRNRGVKKAPFVVLIGANMPSVLAEIGFLSNPREEALLKRSDYRDKLAQAIFRGITRYTDSLSHFQVASAN